MGFRRVASRVFLLSTASLLVLSIGDLGAARAQQQPAPLPPVTVDAPKPVVRRSTTPRRAGASRGPTRRATTPVTVTPPQPAALDVWRSTGNPRPSQTIGNLPPAYTGGQVAIGGRLGGFGNTSVFDTPYSTVNYTSKLIEDQQAFTTSQIVTNDPSVILNASPYSYGETLNIRGLYLFGSDAAFDGLFGIVDPGGRQPIYGIERIEVFKGASTLLNGIPSSGSVAGFINYIPKRATDLPITNYTQSYISRGLFQEHLDVGRRFGEKNEFGVRFNGAFLNGQTPFDNNSKDLGAATLGLDYRGERFRMTVDLGYHDSTNRGELPFYLVGAGVTRIPDAPRAETNTAEKWQKFNSQQGYGATRIEYDIAATTTATFAYGHSENRTKYEYATQTLADNFGLVTRDDYARGDYRQKTDSFETGVRSSGFTGPISHKASVLATQVTSNSDYASGPTTPVPPTNLYNPVYASAPPSLPGQYGPDPYHTETTGLAVGDQIGFLSDRVLVTLGVRLQRVASSGGGGNAYDRTELTPTYAVVVKPLQNVSLYANYIEGLQQGPTAPQGTVNQFTVFAPFVAKQKEAGVKIDWSGKFGTTFAAFEIGTPSAFTNAANVFVVDGLQVNRGLEFNTFGEIYPGVRLIGGVALLDAKLQNTENGTFDGKRAPGTPQIRVTFNAEYDVPVVRGLTLTGRTIYTERAFFDNANTLFIPSWTRFDAGFRYAFNVRTIPTIFRFNVENIANHNYWESAQRGYLYQGAPRTYSVSMQFKF